jgi:hypothetical protein
MKNKLADLNDHLFAQLERLSDEDLIGEKLEEEVKRASAIVEVSDQIVGNAKIQLDAVKTLAMHGDRFKSMLPQLGRSEEPAQPVVDGQSSTLSTN